MPAAIVAEEPVVTEAVMPVAAEVAETVDVLVLPAVGAETRVYASAGVVL